MIDAAPFCMHIWDKNFRMIDCNQATIDMLRIPGKQEYIDNFARYSPEYQPDGSISEEAAVMYIRKAFEEGSQCANWTHITADGEPIPNEIHLKRLDFKGSSYVVAYVRDLREQNRMITELENQGDLMRAINNAAVLLLESDLTDYRQAMNRGMEMIGRCLELDRVIVWENNTREDGKLYLRQVCVWTSENLPHEGLFELSQDVLPNWIIPVSKGEIINGPISEQQQEEQEHMGDRKIESILIIPISLNNEFWGLVSFDDCRKRRVFPDVTVSLLHSWGLIAVGSIQRCSIAVKRAEMEDKLIEALAAAKSASRAKGDFLANMSHEIRTPINAIIGMTNIGKSASDTERMIYCFGKIADASKHLLGIINDILDISKIEAGKFELVPAAFNFDHMIRQAVNVVSLLADDKDQQLNVSVDSAIPQYLYGDDQRLAQVITNLLSNAVKFTPEKGLITLDAIYTGEKDGLCAVRVTVADTGIGISAEQQKNLFQAFQQAESSTSRKFGGTGLGLSISKNIVEMMGGRIRVESEIGKGASFSFTVNVKRADNKMIRKIEQDEAERDITGIFEGRRILLAEAMEINREVVMELLKPTKVEIDCAENGAEAVRMFESSPDKYDLIFMDVQMPEMDGHQATRAIRGMGTAKAATVPIVAMTANVFQKDITECLKSGMNSHLGKPLDLNEIIKLLRSLFCSVK